MWRCLASALLLSTWCASGQFLNGLSKINPEKLAGTLGKVNPSKVADALKDAKIPEAVKSITPDKARQALEGAGDVAGALKSIGGENVSEPHVPMISGALKTAGKSFQDAALKLNSTHSSAIGDALRETSQKSQNLAEALQRSLPKDVVESVKHTDPHKVQDVIHVAGDRIIDVINHVNPNKVEKALEDDPNKVQEIMRIVEKMKMRVNWWTKHRQWILLAIFFLLIATVASAWYFCRTLRSKGPRSPNLLVDSEINMYIRPGGGHRETTEEPLFTQF